MTCKLDDNNDKCEVCELAGSSYLKANNFWFIPTLVYCLFVFFSISDNILLQLQTSVHGWLCYLPHLSYIGYFCLHCVQVSSFLRPSTQEKAFISCFIMVSQNNVCLNWSERWLLYWLWLVQRGKSGDVVELGWRWRWRLGSCQQNFRLYMMFASSFQPQATFVLFSVLLLNLTKVLKKSFLCQPNLNHKKSLKKIEEVILLNHVCHNRFISSI